MNGRMRACRSRAAVVGLALLTGASFLGCHAGPRFFSKKDPVKTSAKAKEEVADRGKFINKKKVRPESDYLRDEDSSDKPIAKSDSKTKPKSSTTTRPKTDDADRSVASRSGTTETKTSRPAKPATGPQRPSSTTSRPEIARKETTRQPKSNLLDDESLFDEKLPETRTASKPVAKLPTKPPSKPVAAAKPLDLEEEENPFPDSPVTRSPTTSKVRVADKKLATTSFNELEDDEDDDDLDDEPDEKEQVISNLRPSTVRTVTKPTTTASPKVDQRITDAPSAAKRKFLPEDELEQQLEDPAEPAQPINRSLPTSSKTAFRPEFPDAGQKKATPVDEPTFPKIPAPSRTASTVRSGLSNTADGRRQPIQADSALAGDFAPRQSQTTKTSPANRDTAPRLDNKPRTNDASPITQSAFDDFDPPTKSQGAVLNGELIIDTSNLPTRFQRNSMSDSEVRGAGASYDANGRTRPNSAASIEIVPGSSTNQSRPAGQILLRSLTPEDADSTHIGNAVFEESSEADNFGAIPGHAADANEAAFSESFPSPGQTASGQDSHASLDVQQSQADAPFLPDVDWNVDKHPTAARAWPTILLIIGSVVSAILIGLGFRSKKLVPAPVSVRKSPIPVEEPGRK